jgi:hypothetical protein
MDRVTRECGALTVDRAERRESAMVDQEVVRAGRSSRSCVAHSPVDLEATTRDVRNHCARVVGNLKIITRRRPSSIRGRSSWSLCVISGELEALRRSLTA